MGSLLPELDELELNGLDCGGGSVSHWNMNTSNIVGTNLTSNRHPVREGYCVQLLARDRALFVVG